MINYLQMFIVKVMAQITVNPNNGIFCYYLVPNTFNLLCLGVENCIQGCSYKD